jgi:DNA polymerase-3 subunit beta
MRLEIAKDKFQDAIFKSEKVAGKNMSLPVLNCLILSAVGSELIIRSTNLDLALVINLPAKVESEGIIAIPAGTLNNFISNINEDKNIILEEKEGNLKVGTVKNSTIIKSYPHEDFPVIPKVEDAISLKINPKSFVKGLKSVYWSASNSNIKPELSSVMIESRDGYLFFAATDSFRLAEKKIQDKGIRDDIHQILLPIKNVSEVIRILDGHDEEASVSLGKNQITFELLNTYLYSRVIDGTFPDYKQLIPKDFKSEAVVLKNDFLNAMRVSTVFSDKFNQITFSINPKTRSFMVETTNSDVGENKTKIDAALNGDPIEIKFNYKYIMDSFLPIEADSISLHLNDNSKPMIVKGVGDTSFTYLVMPMNR